MQRLSLSLLSLLPAVVGFALPHAADAQPPSGPEIGGALAPVEGALTAVEEARVNLFESVRPSVVRVEAAQQPPGLPAPPGPLGPLGGPRRQTGSGIVWDSQGHVVTSYHFVEDNRPASVVLADGSTWEARLVGSDPATDLAVLKIEAPEDKLTPIPPGESQSLRVGQDAFAVGHPFGLDATLHQGIVSGLGREIRSAAGRPIRNLIQTDLAISPGDGGSPLLDRSGRLVGLNTAVSQPPGVSARIAFAVPAETLKRVVPDLIEHGEVVRPVLGITIGAEGAVRRLGLEGGVLVQAVTPGSPADEAGLRPTRTGADGAAVLGDVITAVDGEPVQIPADLLRILDQHKLGDEITLTVQRDGEEVQVPVTLEPLETE